ncbi:TonB-dependent receptor [Plebeiibacterium sediminum]|uniref:TonB-dependent receptor n=1 Tax=Plebeiibacterium sediminum TaxID=2992112 RepID=A0AAE3M0N7_9BACT|nr:TonB-dependent receptor [Plebeiobacterium sediminum]MCW3784864.1 TonB-dependent receptor [Plebeiobacterium sediminum]
MRQKLFVVVMMLFVGLGTTVAQQGFLKGKITDKKTGEELVGAAVVVDGTTIGTITDFMGEYTMPPLEAGTYTIRVQYISYDPQVFNHIVIKTGEETALDVQLNYATMDIEEVQVKAKANRESETILLMDQKKAEVIKESIGAKQLSSMGVSDAATATSKISGVTKSEGSGDIYIRGLGDRYLSTTMNGLPIPSDDVEKKNIDLNMFSTDIIKNVGISKTYSVTNYGDQASGNVDVVSKTISEKISIGLASGVNSNVLQDGMFNNFKSTQNINDVKFGLYNRPYNTLDAITNQSWATESRKLPIAYDASLMAGKKFKVNEKDLSVFATISHSGSSEYLEGVYQKYRMNAQGSSFTDAQTYETKINTTGLLNLSYDLNTKNRISFNTLLVLKTVDELYEAGRNGEGYVRDQLPSQYGAVVRDQNLKETRMWINQLMGSHQLGSKNQLKWALGYNTVNADEPNRIRNEVNMMDDGTVQFAYVGDYQQRKSLQEIEDSELNGYVNNVFKIIDEDQQKLKLNIGANYRKKERDFNSLSIGVRAKGDEFAVSTIDNLDETLLNLSYYEGANSNFRIREGRPDLYNATLNVYGGYLSLGFERNKFSGNVGVRYELDQLEVSWDVNNYVGRTGSASNDYNNILPSLNLKYQLTEKSAFRFAASKTVTLPEFKEVAPFEYVSPTGRVTKGNPELQNSENYNFDLKWELFPNAKDLVSVTGFYKMINDPINMAMTRGSSGYFYFANTGDRADVYGIEFETRFSLIKPEASDMPGVNMVFNATKMWFNQDLLEEFQYNNKTESDLQGAAGFIFNGTLMYDSNKEKRFVATLSGNYSADKIYALGAPESFTYSSTLFNNEIIEKGFFTLDLVLSKKLSDRVSLKLSGKNLLNPKIKQEQRIEPQSEETRTEVVQSYQKGISVKLGISINLN